MLYSFDKKHSNKQTASSPPVNLVLLIAQLTVKTSLEHLAATQKQSQLICIIENYVFDRLQFGSQESFCYGSVKLVKMPRLQRLLRLISLVASSHQRLQLEYRKVRRRHKKTKSGNNAERISKICLLRTE